MKSTIFDVMSQNADNEYIWSEIDLDTRIDKNALIATIIDKAKDARVRYMYISTFKFFTEQFFIRWKYQIGKLLDTLEFEYNPIWNKDGTIKEERGEERNREQKIEDTINETGKETNNRSYNSTDTGNEAPFNTDSYHTKTQDIVNGNEDSTINNTRDTDRDTATNENESTRELIVRTETGNIGITSTQELIREEQALYKDFNIYEWISELYLDDMFITVW